MVAPKDGLWHVGKYNSGAGLLNLWVISYKGPHYGQNDFKQGTKRDLSNCAFT